MEMEVEVSDIAANVADNPDGSGHLKQTLRLKFGAGVELFVEMTTTWPVGTVGELEDRQRAFASMRDVIYELTNEDVETDMENVTMAEFKRIKSEASARG
jgi:hypothetical protein